jgi:hypothetical protein
MQPYMGLGNSLQTAQGGAGGGGRWLGRTRKNHGVWDTSTAGAGSAPRRRELNAKSGQTTNPITSFRNVNNECRVHIM